MACLTENLARHDVPPVGEVHVFPQLMHADPGDSLFAGQELHQPGLFRAVPDRVFMAIQADFAVGNRRVVQVFGSAVAIDARDFLFSNVDLVHEGNGLLDVTG